MPVSALRLEPIKFGDFSNWVTREVKESKLLGGDTKTLYEIAPSKHIPGENKPYSNMGGSPWATSNAYAKVSGIVKGSGTVSPFNRNGNKCARMEAKMEHVKVLGIINMDVMVAGTIFLGHIYEPITSPKGPFSKMEMGVPFTKRPKALVYDFKVDMPNVNTRIKSTGFSPKKHFREETTLRCMCFCRNAGKTRTAISTPKGWAQAESAMTNRFLGQKGMFSK